MKDGLVLLIVGLVGVGGVLLWRAHVDPFHPGQYLNAQPEPRNESEPAVPAPKPVVTRSKPAPAPASVVEAPVVVVAAPPAPKVDPAPAAVQHDPPPFPAVDEIASGAPEDTVTGKFGNPAISALTSSGGHMLGTYVYARDGGRAATVIQLEDGKVASATSKLAPAPPVGISVPRYRRVD